MMIYDSVADKETEQMNTLQWNFAVSLEGFVAGWKTVAWCLWEIGARSTANAHNWKCSNLLSKMVQYLSVYI